MAIVGRHHEGLVITKSGDLEVVSTLSHSEKSIPSSSHFSKSYPSLIVDSLFALDLLKKTTQ